MPHAYARALIALVSKGLTPKEAVQKVFVSLEAKGRMGLAKSIARAFARDAEKELRRSRATLTVAHAKDAKKASANANIGEYEVITDPTLIGGWRLETFDSLIDQSWKKQLVSIYQKTVNL